MSSASGLVIGERASVVQVLEPEGKRKRRRAKCRLQAGFFATDLGSLGSCLFQFRLHGCKSLVHVSILKIVLDQLGFFETESVFHFKLLKAKLVHLGLQGLDLLTKHLDGVVDIVLNKRRGVKRAGRCGRAEGGGRDEGKIGRKTAGNE